MLRGQLHHPSARIELTGTGHDDAQRRNLRDGKVNEHDPALEHLRAQRNVSGKHQHASTRKA
ncbi:hypothetical protein LP419_00270 [Massilia sp. H-1]|nr:hypothetical protein LP419_00270 [Massilia sp. H-1]